MSLIVCRCDAQASLCVVIEQGFGSNAMDTVLVDMSTLRHSSPEQASKLSMFTVPFLFAAYQSTVLLFNALAALQKFDTFSR